LCDKSCSTCQYDSKFCLSCSNLSATIDIFSAEQQPTDILKNNRCIPKKNELCGNGMFYDAEKEACMFCDIICNECFNYSAKDCTKCVEKRPYMKEERCVSNCGDGYYLNKQFNRCFLCNSNCKTCEESSSKCTSCDGNYILNSQNRCAIELSKGCAQSIRFDFLIS
jgi:proprotein convertase subtilisin/kexin type 5